ncbi:AAA domain-containing protein [Nocardioides humi]|uniref:WGR domain-containing protein n=1 Tax=Nocardioides humi TaxID=449461 RepID=A0ABN2BBI6_9ACTN|nr:AAA domain-containing protein [Nocardioides humi]
MRDLVRRAVDLGGLPVDDALALVVPLLEQVARAHEVGRVAPLRGLGDLSVAEEHRIEFDERAALPAQHNRAALEQVERELASRSFEVRRGAGQVVDLASGLRTTTTDQGETAAHPRVRLVPGWQRWEHEIEHHDQLTDIGSLGELLAALLCGLDLADADDLQRLERHRGNLFALAPGLHPVVAGVVTSMVEPDRRRRTQDLLDVTERLRTYRDHPEDFDLDRVLVAGGTADRRTVVLEHLRDRLFDVSRRNPLLHFRSTGRTLNLTQASVPLVLDVRSVRAEQLFTWGGPVSARLVAGKPVDLGAVVRWDDAPYAEQAIDAVMSQARRDRAEYGQDQLRIVVAFLRWHDVHEDPDAPILSPLVLAAAQLTKKRGVRHSYRLQLVEPGQAEVNPVLRHQLRDRYGFELPATVDLTDPGAVDALRAEIERQARATERGVSVVLVDQPRIELIRSRAQTALQAYRRRRSGSRPSIGRRHYAYSYTRPSWQPLGVQIFEDRLVRSPLPFAVELGDEPAPRAQAVGTAGAVERELYTLTEGETNPYRWEVDLCAVSLANFNYRTLSLVRDYDALLAETRSQPVFDELFSAEPREAPAAAAAMPLPERHLVVSADDSQLAAIAQARADDNFVIQGPPGTGKSQTITNLVADYLARGKRVLFICQKRAALDVVHARLRSRGLDEICTLVHDSQADKKAFVHGLRDTYEAWSAAEDDLADLEAARDALVSELTGIRAEVEGYDAALGGPGQRGARVIDHLDRLVALRHARWGEELSADRQLLVPAPEAWQAARGAVDRLGEALARAGHGRILARSPLSAVEPSVLGDPRAELTVGAAAEALAGALARPRALLVAAGGPDPGALSLSQVWQVAELHALLDPLARRGALGVLSGRSVAATELTAAADRQRAAREAAEAAAQAAAGWAEAPGPEEARAALEVARHKEGAAFRFFNGEWRRVRGLVGRGWRGPALPASRALGLLVAHYDAAGAATADDAEAERVYGHADLSALATALEVARRLEWPLAAWRDLLATSDDRAREALDALPAVLPGVEAAAAGVLAVEHLSLDAAAGVAAALAAPAGRDAVRAAAPSLRELAAQPAVLEAVRRLDAEPDQLEYAVVAAALRTARASHPQLDRLDGRRLGDLVERVATLEPDLHRANAAVIVGRLRHRFRERVEHSTRSVTGMDDAQRALKRTWSTGRRELEHEFGKVRAYKSIRQLAGGESGEVVAALRPVWLMSPASLSDILELASSFDVVVFDEASQVPVEEAVPALHRAGQVVVVGDRMQLPPTRYFRAGGPAPDTEVDDGAPDDESGTQVGVVLDADSFLAVASTRLPSTMLLWHYRSRHEALIQFSNAAFYDGRLATVPDREPLPEGRTRLVVGASESPDPEQVRATTDAILDRSISVVRVSDGIYTRRTNPAEARWVAEVVRDLLLRGTGLSIGVVAFSEAQQTEIESALAALAADDREFATAYETEVDREEDGQALGLFVKNLENVQGDERDVIVMSVCYAPGPDGRMRMNFGPINNSGGEKRLNVIFSRARRHMVLVSSIEPTMITNTYNDGASALRGFLQYADAVSEGDRAAMESALGSWARSGAGWSATPAIVEQLSAALGKRGVDVALAVGQSGFRCDLALRRAGDPAWRTAVLVDHADRVDGATGEQRRTVQPAVLRSAGWTVEQVLATDWLEDPDGVTERLVASLG